MLCYLKLKEFLEYFRGNNIKNKQKEKNMPQIILTAIIIVAGLVITPFVILGALIYFGYKLSQNTKDLSSYKRFFWLTNQEKSEFKELYKKALNKHKNDIEVHKEDLKIHSENLEVYYHKKEKLEIEFNQYQEKILKLKEQADDNKISKNKDGSYSKHSSLGKKIQQEIERLEEERDRVKYLYATLYEPSKPSEPNFYFSAPDRLRLLPKEKWNSFNDLWEEYNRNRKGTKSTIWAFYGWILSGVLVEWFTDGPISLLTILLAGIGATISYFIVDHYYKKAAHGIPEPESVTPKNIDTHIEPKQSISLCRNIECFWKDLSRFGNMSIIADELYLSHDQLTELPKEIGQLTGLARLDVNNNQLSELPKEIGQLTNLTRLDLEYNKFIKLPKEIGQLTNLTGLFLADNQLIELPKEIGQLSSLTKLFLSDNQLTELPKETGQLSSLAWLLLSDNQLTELPKEIRQLSSLTKLFLDHNQLTELPKEIGQLTNLTGLYLRCNQLTELPEEIGQLTSLTELWLPENQLTELPKEIGQLANLVELSFLENQLTELPKEIGQLTNLTFLSLVDNQLTELPNEIIQLTRLTFLDLSKNANLHLTSAQIKWLEKLEKNHCEVWQ